MDISIKAVNKPALHTSDCLVLTVFAGKQLSEAAQQIDQAADGQISQLLKRGDIDGELGQTLLLPHTPKIKAQRVLLLGCGKSDALSPGDYKKLLDSLLQQLQSARIAQASLFFAQLRVAGREPSWALQQCALQAELASYRYRSTVSKTKPQAACKKLLWVAHSSKELQQASAEGLGMARGMNLARELGNLPGNICTPGYLANQAKALARKHKGLSVSVLEEKAMRELGMGALLSVSAGSAQPAKLITLDYRGSSKKNARPYVLVGKGITFDSGGIILKPGAKMDEMKYDMCGAASVLGVIQAIAELGAPINVVGIIAAAENLPSGTASKPGDVVTSMSGQTIEILNTDAEGRLVLCDALSYAERFKPVSLIDIATLTGACVVALGSHASGLYSNQQALADALLAAGEEVGDRAWQMPLWDDYQSQLNSNFADIANVGGPEGGSITAACFLSRFTDKQQWAHLDIAGTAWTSGAQKGASGRPVALLTQYLLKQASQ